MAKTILAVDDSVTMRKILEITFAGTDFNVVTVASANDAVAKLRAEPFAIVICDQSLDPSGYEVTKQLKAAASGTPVLLLSSRHNPFDAGQGGSAGVDDHIDKPFDTQQLIDRVTKIVGAGVSAPAAAATSAPAPAAGAARARTLIYGGPTAPASTPAPAPVAAKPAPAPAPAPTPAPAPKPIAAPAPKPAPAPMASPAPAAAPAARPAIAAAVNGQLAAKVADLGLSPAQVEAVLALSREVVERVVWEVVPVLAETLIKEEIVRLTK